jgi:ATP-binding cassette subfamily B protein/ATP-binding cassette subfamily C protein LapB
MSKAGRRWLPDLSGSNAIVWRVWADLWRANRSHLVWTLVAGVLINLLGLALPVFSSIVYDRIMGNGAFASLWALAIGVACGVVLEVVLRQARVLVVEYVGARWDRALDTLVFQGLLRSGLARPPELGPVLARYRDVVASRDFLSSAWLLPLADLPFILLFLLVIGLLGGPVALVALFFGVVLLVVSVLSHLSARRFQRRQIRDANDKISLLAEAIACLEQLRRPRSGQRAAGRFASLSDSGSRDAAQARMRYALHQSITPGLTTLSTAGTLVTGVYLVENQSMTTGALLACTLLVSRCVALFGSVAALANRYEDFKRAMDELGGVLQLPDDRRALKPVKMKPQRLSSPEFALSKVGFRREGADRAVLAEVSLTIPPLQFVALLGSSGAGKSTLLRLLAGRLTVSDGALTAGGVPVSAGNAAWLAGCVGYKPQDPQFVGMTIGELLADSGERATPAARLAMLRAVGLGRALDAGELNLTTPLGPFVGGVSGGQRQMLALACALLQSEEVLLLDEPTLGLDSEALKQVLGVFAALKGKRTIVVATHAAELIHMADRLILVGDGRVLADGPREQLMAPSAASGQVPAAA